MKITIASTEYDKVVVDQFKNEVLTRFNKVTSTDMYTVEEFNITEALKVFFPWDEHHDFSTHLLSKGQVLQARAKNEWSRPDSLVKFPWFGWWYTGYVKVIHYRNVNMVWETMETKEIFVEFWKNGEGAIIVPRGLGWKPEQIVCGSDVAAKMSSAKTFNRARKAGWL